MAPSYFPLRWESTGDQWWYASPIDFAAANGHYDLVRELLRLDNNHLIKLTSLRRIRRLETVWDDDDDHFHDVAKCRSRVARHLFDECRQPKLGNNSLIRAGYGGWLMYTAASAGDLGFVRELLERHPLLVFGEGEYGATDILYAAARSKSWEVFRLVLECAISAGDGGEEIECVFKWEMMNRAVHAAARGGNLKILKQLLGRSNALGYRDAHGSTVLHAAASKGQVEVVKDVIQCFDITESRDNEGNTALHIAAYKGQPAVVEALITASPSLVSSTNNAGETFVHSTVCGFLSCAFRRLDKQTELMKLLVSSAELLAGIVNSKNNEGRTALHTAVIGNVHSHLVELLMSVPSINVNTHDAHGMTPLDLLKHRPPSASSEILIRQLISAGGVFGTHDYTTRRAMVSHLKMQGNGNSPGTRFGISDTEIFLYTPNAIGITKGNEKRSSSIITNKKQAGAVNVAAQRLRRALHWPLKKDKKPKQVADDGSVGSSRKWSSSEEPPTPLRQRFSKTLPNNKRTLSVRSNASSPLAKKKFASGIVQGVMQAMPHLAVHAHSHSKSLSKSSFSSSGSLDKQKGVYVPREEVVASCSKADEGVPNLGAKQGSLRRLRNQYLCFGSHGLSVKLQESHRSSCVATA